MIIAAANYGGLGIHKNLAMIKKTQRGGKLVVCKNPDLWEINAVQRSRFKDKILIWSIHVHIGRTCWKFLTLTISAQNHVTRGKDSRTWSRKDRVALRHSDPGLNRYPCMAHNTFWLSNLDF